jgi:predicted nucleic acid-binding protein
MKEQVLVDTGPLVAIFSDRDSKHQVCLDQLKQIRPPLISTWPVLTEAAWLLRKQITGVQSLFKACQSNLLVVPTLDEAAFAWIADFLLCYEKKTPQLADASLVYLADRDNLDTVFTLDRRDFSVYRFRRNRSFQLLP